MAEGRPEYRILARVLERPMKPDVKLSTAHPLSGRYEQGATRYVGADGKFKLVPYRDPAMEHVIWEVYKRRPD